MNVRAALPLLLAFVLPAGLCALPQDAHGELIRVATVKGGINPAVSDYLKRTIGDASRDGAHAVVIELDTPGGLLTATQDIVSEILNADVPVIVFVSPRGAWAGSAGTFITMAGHVAAMAPGTSIGAAHPVSALPTPPAPPGEDGKEKAPPVRDVQGEKIENFAAAFIESIAEARNRNVEWAADAVRNSVAITQKEALEKNVIDLVADDFDHLLELIDGRVVEIDRESVTLKTASATVERIEMRLVNRFFDVISDPSIAILLLLGGLLGLYVEFTQPGMLFPGIAGVVCLVLLGLSLQVIPFNSIGLLLIGTGVALMVAEIFFTSYGVLFAAGVAALGMGAYVVFDVPEASDLVVPFWSVIFPAVAGFAVLGAIVVIGVSQSMTRPQFAGNEGMVGQIAVVDSELAPIGRVFMHGEYWNAEADEAIPVGARVRVVAVDDLNLRVTKMETSG